MIERLKSVKECLMSTVQGQMGDLANVDAKELGEVVDMVKDLEEAIYYCTITKAMEESEKEGKHHEKYYNDYNMRYYYDPAIHSGNIRYYDPSRDMDRMYGRMYYDGGDMMYYNGGTGGSSSSGNSSSSTNGSMNGSSRNYTEREYPVQMRDRREGRSPVSRRTYMEAKEMKKGKAAQIQELEKYMTELSHDLVEMIEDASPEEQQYLHKKLTSLASKVQSING